MELYKGDIADGKRDGFGIQIFPNGYKYTGEWKKNYAHGKGKLDYTDGTYYEGEFKQNKIIEGILSFHNGIRFAGKFCLDERNKDKFLEGTIVFRNGDMFKGTWLNGVPNSGSYIQKQGVFRDYKKDEDFYDYDDTEGGFGKLIIANTEDIYEGGFKDGLQEGQGFIFSSYPHYESFRNLNGKLHGKYLCNYISGGYCYEGTYDHDKRVGKWKYQTVRGYFFEGDQDFKNGTVTFPFMNEDYFTGEVEIKFQNITFKNGVYNYRDSTGKYHQIHVRDLRVVDDLEIKIGKSFNFDQVSARLENSKLSPEKPVLNGEHTYHYPDGSVYCGNFAFDFIYVHKDDLPKCFKKAQENSKFNPYNISMQDLYRYSNKNSGPHEKKFKGMLNDGLKDGYCEIEYSDGSVFKGYFNNGMKTGNCIMKNTKGNTIIGDYINDVLNGPVTIHRPNGDEIHTKADNGVISNDNVTILKKNGLFYEGQVKDYVKHGYGTLTYTNNYKLKSYFSNSEIDTKDEPALLIDTEGVITKCHYTSLEGRDIGILESIDDGTVYVYNTNKGTIHKAQ